MDSYNQKQQQQAGSGLTRYRSAPSSYFSSFLNSVDGFGGDDFDRLLNPRASSPDPSGSFSRFMSNTGGENSNFNSNSGSSFFNVGQSSVSAATNVAAAPSQFMATMKVEADIVQQQQQMQLQRQQSNDYSSGSQPQTVYQSQDQRIHNLETASASVVDNTYRLLSSINSDRSAQMKMVGTGNSGLIRQSSSPAGFFAQISMENEYGEMRGMGSFGAGNSANAEASYSSGTRFKGQRDFSSGQPSSSGLMSPISENDVKSMGETSHNDGGFGERRRDDSSYLTGFPVASWDDSVVLPEDLLAGDEDSKHFPNLDVSGNQTSEVQNRPPTRLSHHLSLPKSSAELSAMEMLLQDSVPCKIRAKRGFATHPRSIAERVRRTRISERMRKLQELVPNMDKQTNTSDMLDLAVDYIKDLQQQVQTLSDNRAKCTCSNIQNS